MHFQLGGEKQALNIILHIKIGEKFWTGNDWQTELGPIKVVASECRPYNAHCTEKADFIHFSYTLS